MLNHSRVTTLPNGARVATVEMPEAESAVVGIWVKVGSRYESKEVNGICHYIEHLLFKGTKKRTAKDITEAIEGSGGYLNAYTSEEHTCYYARLPSEKLELAFDVLADMYLNPTLAAAEVERERDVILEEIRMYRDQPQSLVMEKLSELLWSNHSAGRSVSGEEDSVRGLTRATIEQFRKATYTPAATVFTFSGNVRHDRCVEVVRKATARQAKAKMPRFPMVTSRTAQRPISLVAREIEQTHAALAFRIFGRHDPRRYALRVLNGILGENMSSRLFQAVREKHGLCYTIHSSCQMFEETGALMIYAGLDRRRAADGLRRTLREVARLRTTRVTKGELQRVQDYLTGVFRLSLESSSSRMNWVGESLLAYDTLISPQDVIDGIRAVKAEEIRELAQTIFTPGNLSLSLVVPSTEKLTQEEWYAIARASLNAQ